MDLLVDLVEGVDIDIVEQPIVGLDDDRLDVDDFFFGQVAQQRFDNQCVVVRVLDPARAEFYRRRGLRTVCPTSVAIDVLIDAVRACELKPAETPA